MRQYLDAKHRYQDAILFFRMGDFYEMFYEDALTASRALDITLTSRSKDAAGQGIPMCGVPHHAADGYISRLVKKGFRVAVCEQMEDAKKAKGVVRREVVRVVSPGTFTDAGYLDEREPALLMAVAPSAGTPESGRIDTIGVALLDLSTGEFSAAEYHGTHRVEALRDEVSVLRPREILVPRGFDLAGTLPAITQLPIAVTEANPWTFEPESARQILTEQLRTQSLEGFGLEPHPAAIAAAGAIVHYVRDTQPGDLAHLRGISFRHPTDHLVLDPSTLKHLEIVEASEGGRRGSLLHEIDTTVSAMGGRMLRAWLLRPLLALEPIQTRLDAVEEFAFRTTERAKLRDRLKPIHDLERLLARAALGSGGPRDLVALKDSVTHIPQVRHVVSEFTAPLVTSLLGELDDLTDVRDDIEATLVNEPPAQARDGGAVRDGIDRELDELRDVSRSGKARIAEMEATERARTGITSLKIRYNRVFGYFLEVSKANLHAVPDDYVRKQTTVGAERYVTPALKDYEEKVLGADERIVERELELFEALRLRVADHAARIQRSARVLATLDVLATLADLAATRDYTKPHVHAGTELELAEARHPVVERHTTEAFVPNDIQLDAVSHQLIILTGPNMGGKSTFLRQTALVCVMAQAGSFVPCRSAKVPIVDRIFARVGASDNIARGQSTFMVEMTETANILHSATNRSLVLLDEVGRGTATYDGLSIAWAVAEFLATNGTVSPKTIFATHYHELTDLADSHPNIANFHAVAREWKDEIVFLRKIAPGRSDRSYGVQVARLAGLPAPVVARAREILQSLECDELWRGGRPALSDQSATTQQQLGLFQTDGPHALLVERLRQVDLERMTPLDALTLLAELKREIEP
jgi:DNA mismatch repair protein MutS